VQRWYRGAGEAECRALLDGWYSITGAYRVSYVVYGPNERALQRDPNTPTPCLNLLIPIVEFGDVTLYRYPNPGIGQ
jgi:hypothetical protein